MADNEKKYIPEEDEEPGKFVRRIIAEQPDRERKLHQLDNDILKRKQTQIFIETPYRNNHIFNSILTVLSPNLRLCVAANLTTEEEFIQTKTIAQWRKQPLDLHKQPAIFLLYV